jgi:uncharacterized phiE125 gp8 family phage protein
VSSLVVVPNQTIVEPVDLTTAKNFLRVTISDDDTLISALITAAREVVETFTGRSLATKTYRQSLDAFPYFTDSVMSQQAYPPSYYSLPRYSTTLWNYSQMIKLFAPPLLTVLDIKYTDTNGVVQTLDPTKYIVDSDSQPARIFPGPAGSNWPACLYIPNAVQIDFLAGYNTVLSLGQPVPKGIVIAILMLVANYYENREAAQPGSFSEIPNHIRQILWSHRVLDFQPTRG